ncbi:MAG: putative ABC transporter permease [Clostridia bacterium]|nr:putative ABC transporter permease [Clostridia bacterium]
MEVFLLFVLYSFFGCVMENAYYYVLHKKYISKRTLLNLPLCPVYGIAALMLAAVNGEIQNPLLLFCNGFLTVSAVELMFYLLSLKLYGVKWWDYSGLRINFMGGVSLFYSTLWGFLNIAFAKVLHPLCRGWILSLPGTSKLLCGLFLAVYLAADLKETHRELLKYKNGEESLINQKFLYIKSNN